MDYAARAFALGLLVFALPVAVLAMEPRYGGFSAPTGIAFAEDGAMYVSNWGGGTVERVGPDGSRGVAASGIPSPAGVAFDAAGRLYAASYSGDFVARVEQDGALIKVAEGLSTPTGIAFSADGRLLVANRASGEIVAVDAESGEAHRLADGLSLPVGVVEMPDASLVVSQYGGFVTRILPDGSRQELGVSFARPGVGIVADGPDAVLVVDNGAGVVRRVDFSGASVVVADGLAGSVVALGRAENGDLAVGTWGAGNVYLFHIDIKEKSMKSTRYENGLAMLKRIDGSVGERVVESLQDIAPDFADYLIEFPFGDIYARPGLDLKSREIAVVAALTALGNARPQLKVHLSAALNVGCTREEIVEVVMMMAVYAGFPAALNGLSAAKEVFAEHGAADAAR